MWQCNIYSPGDLEKRYHEHEWLKGSPAEVDYYKRWRLAELHEIIKRVKCEAACIVNSISDKKTM